MAELVRTVQSGITQTASLLEWRCSICFFLFLCGSLFTVFVITIEIILCIGYENMFGDKVWSTLYFNDVREYIHFIQERYLGIKGYRNTARD